MPENVVRIRIETQGASEAADAAEHSAGRIKGALSGIGQGLSFGAGFEIARKGIDTLTDAFHGMIEAASSQAQIVAQTEAAIKSTGGAAGLTADQIGEMADSLTKVTTFSDDTIQSGENLLLTFTSIGKDVFPQATKTMLDMSQALGQDTKSSAIQLGKALNDPIQGMTALQRVGVSFTEAQKTQVKAMQESGNLMGAQKLILGELTREFGGSAEAAGKTFPGQLKILGNELGLLQEKIGTQLLAALAEVGKVAIPLVVRGFELLEQGVDRVSAVIGAAWARISGAFSAGGLRGALMAIGGLFGDLAETIGAGLRRIPGLLHDAWNAIWSGAQALAGAISGVIAGIDWGAVGGAIVAGLRGVGAFVERHWKEILVYVVYGLPGLIALEIGNAIGWEKIGTAIVSGLTAGAHLATRLGSWLKSEVASIPWSEVWAGVRSAGAALMERLSAGVNLAQTLGAWLGAQVARIDWGAVWANIQGAAEGLRNALSGLDVGAALGVLTQKVAELGDTVSTKLGGDKPGIAKALFDSLGQNAGGALSSTVSLVGQLGDQFQKLLQSRELAGFMDSLNAAWAAMQESVAPLLSILQTLGGVLGAVLLVALDGVLAVLRELEPVVSAALVPAFTLLSGVIEAAGIVIRTFAKEVRDTLMLIDDLIHGRWSAAWEDAKHIVGDALAGAWALVTSWVSHVTGAFDELVTGVGGALLRLAADVAGKLGELTVSGLAKIGEWTAGMLKAIGQFELDAVSSLARWVGDAVSKIGELPGQAKAALGDVSSLLVSAGEDLIGGFIQGIVNKAKDIPGALKDALGGVVGDVRGIFGANSPSKVFAAIGADLMTGLAEGVQANTATVQQAVGSAAAQIVAWARQYAAQHGLDPVALAAMEVAINQYEAGGSLANPFQFMNTLAAQYGQGGSPAQQLDVLAGMGRVNAAYRAFVAAGGGAAGLRAAENIQEIPGDAAIVARGQAALSQAAAVGQVAAAALSVGGSAVSTANPVPVAIISDSSAAATQSAGRAGSAPPETTFDLLNRLAALAAAPRVPQAAPGGLMSTPRPGPDILSPGGLGGAPLLADVIAKHVSGGLAPLTDASGKAAAAVAQLATGADAAEATFAKAPPMLEAAVVAAAGGLSAGADEMGKGATNATAAFIAAATAAGGLTSGLQAAGGLTPPVREAGAAMGELSATGHLLANTQEFVSTKSLEAAKALGTVATSAAVIAQAVGTPGTWNGEGGPAGPGGGGPGTIPQGGFPGVLTISSLGTWGVGYAKQSTPNQGSSQPPGLFAGPPYVPPPTGNLFAVPAAETAAGMPSTPSTTTANIFLDSTLIASASVTQYGRHRALNVRMK